jgi:putative transposase
MPNYRRSKAGGGTFFFTLALADRSSGLLIRHIEQLRSVYASVQRHHPFETVAICILPDHLHAIWTLPENDADYPKRWSLIKSGFSRPLSTSPSRSPSKIAKREKGIWQRRYWEHTIRDEADLAAHVDYVHYNPVKHGLVTCAADWPHSSLHTFIVRGDLPPDWGGDTQDQSGNFGES